MAAWAVVSRAARTSAPAWIRPSQGRTDRPDGAVKWWGAGRDPGCGLSGTSRRPRATRRS